MATESRVYNIPLERATSENPLLVRNGIGPFPPSDRLEISNFRRALPQFLAVSVKNILLFVYGMTLGFPTIVIPAIQGGEGREPSDIVLNRDEISWFSSINLICVPLGCLFSGILTQPIGKRRAMQLVNLPILASWMLFHFASQTAHLYAALCLSGLGGGLMEAPVLTYVAEITEPKYRGILSALGSTCVITGVFIQFIMGSLMDWRTVAAVSAAFPVISIIALCFVPESPTWLIREQRFREAVKALQWLRGWVPEHRIEAEFNRLYEELITGPALEEAAEGVQSDGKPHWWAARLRMFRKRSFLVPFLLVSFTFFAGHFSGKTPLQTYAVQIFHTLKAPINKYHATILLGVAELIATIICVFLIHFTGKRPLVLVSTIGIGVCLFGTATYAHYLNVVPGFAVNNVVVNASSIVPKESIISRENITKIFETEEKALLLKTSMEFTTSSIADNTNYTTVLPVADREEEVEGFTSNPQMAETIAIEQTTFGNMTPDVGANTESGNNTTSILHLYDPEEATTITDADLLVGEDPKPIVMPETLEEKERIVNVKKVVDEILISVPQQKTNTVVWLPMMLLLGAAFSAHLGIRMIPWILIGEVFPAPVRSTASGLVSGLGYIFGFLANKLFLQMLSAFTLPGTFWFYSLVAFTAAITLYFTLPETEGRTLGEIEAHFSKKSTTNLLSKKQQYNAALSQLDNSVDLQKTVGPHVGGGIILLQQNDHLPPHDRTVDGSLNFAFEGHNSTTHL